MPGIIRRPRIGIVDVNEAADEDKADIVWCPNCKEAGAFSKMGRRADFDEKTGKTIVPNDADNWLQCIECGHIIPKYQGKGVGRLIVDPQFETVENRFDFGNAIIESVRDDRRIDRSDLQTRAKKKLFKKKLSEIKDPDIKREILEGGEIISYDSTRL
jgi:hypothetical protein